MKKIILSKKKADRFFNLLALTTITLLVLSGTQRSVLLLSFITSLLLVVNQFRLQRAIDAINKDSGENLGYGVIEKRTFLSQDGFRIVEVSLNSERLAVLVTKNLFIKGSVGDRIKLCRIHGKIYGE